MANDRIKVVGYAEKVTHNGNIEYRNFSDDLVGFQSTGGQSLFTLGNFEITTNLDSNPSKLFTTNKFSKFLNFCDLDLTTDESEILLTNNSDVKLKLDKTNLCNYAYFGSLLEYVRVGLEDIITKWPASLYMNPIKGIVSDNLTIEDYSWDYIEDEATFKINIDIIRNPYLINYLANGTIVDTFNETNDLRNFTVNFGSYVVLTNELEYDVLAYTAATTTADDYIYLKVKGNPFDNLTGNTGTTTYHIKPAKIKEDGFFNQLPDFQANLLNRFTAPKYSSTYKYPERDDSGVLQFQNSTLTWPVTDGYNIDFDSTDYITYVNKLIKIATNFDANKTNLMVRFLTAEAISDFDTQPRCDGEVEESAGQKMNRTLKIYGREYDEIKRRIDGIQYANTVSYNQEDNTPDAVLKYLARTMGWGLVSSVLENDLLKSYVTTPDSTFSGQSRGLTAVEAEVEMWRRLILNSAWLWKSKGARKGVEFLFKFIGAPDGLIEFNEFIYVVKNAIDVDQFKLLLKENGLDTDLDNYNIDSDGYPYVFPNNSDMYFQKGGLWYRQTAGSGATVDTLEGNNPHLGPYDGGAAYINQFNVAIPNFSAVTVTSSTVTTGTTNLFSNYQSGTINTYTGDYFIDIETDYGVSLDNCYVVKTTKILDPYPTAIELTACGCEVDGNNDYALKIDISSNEPTINTITVNCTNNIVGNIVTTNDGWMLFTYKAYNDKGFWVNQTYDSHYINQDCCKVVGGVSHYYEDYNNATPKEFVNSGYICCKTQKCGCSLTCDWVLTTSVFAELPLISGRRYLSFTKPSGDVTMVTPNGCSCISNYTIPVNNFTDPNTGEIGVACALTDLGVNSLTTETTYYYTRQSKNSLSLTNYSWPDVNTVMDSLGNPIGKPPKGSIKGWLSYVYDARSNGTLDCSKYMNTTGVNIGGKLPLSPRNNNGLII